MWPRTDLIDLLGITHPIIQAPMGSFGGPALVAAVSNAGALGSLSCASLSAQTARDQIEELRRASNRPFNLNFFVHRTPSIDAQLTSRMRNGLLPITMSSAWAPCRSQAAICFLVLTRSGFSWCLI